MGRDSLVSIPALDHAPMDAAEQTPERGVVATRRSRLFWRVLALVGTLAIYSVYRTFRVGAGRDAFERGVPVEPFRHALTVMKVEHALWLDIEQGLQNIFVQHGLVIRLANAYYSWGHQAMTLAVVAAVLLKAPWRDAKRWVGGLLLQLPIGLALFRLYPLMPPRLLDAGAPWGGRILQIHRGLRPTGIVDTLATVQGPWTPDPVQLTAFTNQYAAMPSLHCAFSLWVGIVWWQWAKGHRWRMVGPIHSAFMFFCVVVTGNHFVLDAVVGWFIAIGCLWFTGRLVGHRRHRRLFAYGSGEPSDDDLVELPDAPHRTSNLIPSIAADSQ